MDKEKLRDEGLNYLITSNFVDAYVKKLMMPSDIDSLYDDYRQEAYMTILELKNSVWEKLYNSSIAKETDFYYEIRNYVSRVIRNTVHSTSSAAYRKLKGCVRKETQQDSVMWSVMQNSIPDDRTITDTIREGNE